MFAKEKNVLGDVTIYIDENKLPTYYAESYFLYKNHLNYLSQKINKYKSYENSSQRKDYFKELNKAYIQNGSNTHKIVSVLEKKVTISAYENLKINGTDNTQTTLKDYIYLRRDWTYLEEAEKQLKTTIESIKEELSKIKHKKNNSLFLGCGVGRIAFEFIDIYEKVYATDKSFSMIWHLQKLLNAETINFFNPHEKNVHKLENVAQAYQAKIPTESLKLKNKFQAFVSDVLDLPFESGTVDSIFSIYFTDVIALKLWFKEINDKLSGNGLFIHFGPLDYFFSDEREMLTAEEFKKTFENNGYKTLVDKIIETPHLEDSNSISYKVYRNWFFIAQKEKKTSINHNISDDTIFKINRPISYERKGIINKGVEEQEVNIGLPNGKFGGAQPVIQILELIDEKNTFSDLMSILKDSGLIADKGEIKGLLNNLLSQGVLTIL